jgi:hypothetical protein
MSFRKLFSNEEKLIELLVNQASLKLPTDWKNTIRVESMNDGGMGSLTLFLKGVRKENRRFAHNVSNVEFLDKDGISVLAGLFLDQNKELFELDIFKGDGSPLIEIPDISQMKTVRTS